MSKLLDQFDVVPVGNFVILQREVEKTMTEGGLHLPTRAQVDSLRATVLAVGPGVVVNGGTFVPTTVRVGDTVLVDKIGGFNLEVNEGEKLLVVREAEIIAVLKERT